MTTALTSSLSVEQDAAEVPWWAGNFRLTNYISEAARRSCGACWSNRSLGWSYDLI
jgi:hypothetical protein